MWIFYYKEKRKISHIIKDYYQYVQQLIDQKWLFAKTKYNLND